MGTVFVDSLYPLPVPFTDVRNPYYRISKQQFHDHRDAHPNEFIHFGRESDVPVKDDGFACFPGEAQQKKARTDKSIRAASIFLEQQLYLWSSSAHHTFILFRRFSG